MEELTYFDGIAEAADFVFDMLEDERLWCIEMAKVDSANIISRLAHRLDSYMDDMREQWNA